MPFTTSLPSHPSSTLSSLSFDQVQTLFASLLASNTDYHVPVPVWRAYRDGDGQPVNLREHQDAFEFFSRIADVLQTAMQAGAGAARGEGAVAEDGGAKETTGTQHEGKAGGSPCKDPFVAVYGGKLAQQVKQEGEGLITCIDGFNHSVKPFQLLMRPYHPSWLPLLPRLLVPLLHHSTSLYVSVSPLTLQLCNSISLKVLKCMTVQDSVSLSLCKSVSL